MRDWARVRERYMRDDLPVRLGGLSATLARLTSAAELPLNQKLAEGLMDEGKWFIEWTAREAEINVGAQLAQIQLQLARWRRHIDAIWQDKYKRSELSNQTKAWSDRVLQLSGLLGEQ